MAVQRAIVDQDIGMTPTTFDNPMGIAGFEFVEFAAPEGQGDAMRAYFEGMGFSAVARHRNRAITLFLSLIHI